MFALVCESPTGAFDTHSNLPAAQKSTAGPLGWMRSGAAGQYSSAFCFPLRGTGKQNRGIVQCLHWTMHMPYGMCDYTFESADSAKKHRRPFGLRCFFGAAGQIRTADLILTKDALYLLSYSSKVHAPRKGHDGDREGT